VGAGRHVLKLPPQLASGPQQPLTGQPPALSKQQQPQATIVRILDMLVTSYSKLQVCARCALAGWWVARVPR
jgi:hypothetical protein